MKMEIVAECASGWQSLNTEQFASRSRIDAWNRFGSETFCPMYVDCEERDSFRATIARTNFGSLGMAVLRASPAQASANCNLSSRTAAQDTDALLLVVPQMGTCSSEQDHRVEYLAPGDLLIRDLSRAWIHRSEEEMELINLKLPFTALQDRVDDPERLVGKTLHGSRPEVAIAVDLIRSAYRTLSHTSEGPWREALAELVLDSVQMLYRVCEDTPASRREMNSAVGLRREAMRYMHANLDDAELTVASLADALAVSTRQLQRAFLNTGQTPSSYLWNQRLDIAARMLEAGSCSSVTDVAFAVGFKDLGHFSRSFSERYGAAPSKYRGSAPIVR